MILYHRLVEQVALLGHPVTARGLTTRELLGQGVQHRAGHLVNRKGLNRALGYMELMQLVAGKFNTEALARVAPKARLDLFTEQAAYGPRVYNECNDQLADVLMKLATDPATRQAVMYMSNPEEGFNYRPCTNSIQLLVRDNEVHCVVSMRSWDLYLGAPYDLMMFGGLVLVAARCLRVQPGWVHVHAGSAHIYEDNLPKYRGRWAHQPDRAFGFDPEFNTLSEFREWAEAVILDQCWTTGAPLGIREYQL